MPRKQPLRYDQGVVCGARGDAGEIKRHPEVETLQMARDTSAEATKKVPSPLMEAAN